MASQPACSRRRRRKRQCRSSDRQAVQIRTTRLILRPWREDDLPAFAEQNADPVVMTFLGGALTREESDAYVRRAEAHLTETGFCKRAVEVPGVSPFIGAVGLTRVKFEASFAGSGATVMRRRRHA